MGDEEVGKRSPVVSSLKIRLFDSLSLLEATANGVGKVGFHQSVVSTFEGVPGGGGGSQHRWSIELTAVDREGWGKGFLGGLRSHHYGETNSQIPGNLCDVP